MRPFVSIIVAIYQAEAYLHRCVDSILSQTENNFELLLIDDGSTDKSGLICDEYALIDERVRVFHKENEGVSATRQFGINQCRGKYTIHCDPDDWIDPDMLDAMYKKAISTGADIVMCDMMLEYEGYSKVCRQYTSRLDSENLRNIIFYPLSAGLCNKLIKLDCYSKYNVYFAKEIAYGEDLFVMLQLLMHPLCIEYIPRAYYHYDQYSNEGSLCKNIDYENIQKTIGVFIDKIGDCPAVCKLKISLIQHIHRDDTENFSHFDDLYPEVNMDILKIGLFHPITKWRNLSIALHRFHFYKMSVFYTRMIEGIKHIIEAYCGTKKMF